MKYSFYCLSLNEQRSQIMKSRFAEQNLEVAINPGVPPTDGRINGRELSAELARIWSTFYGHLDMLRWFYFTTDHDIGFFCEDDIIIHKNFRNYLPEILESFSELNLDILSLGYLCENPIDTYSNFPTIKSPTETLPHKFLEYPDSLWGCQMFALTREKAKELLDKYSTDYADRTLSDKSLTPFSSDWTLTKEGKRALIYPLLVIEDGKDTIGDLRHKRAHLACHYFSYNETVFYKSL